MNEVMKCQDPQCDRDIQVIDKRIVGRNIVTTGWCDIDGEQEVVD